MSNITPRRRISINSGLQEAKEAALKPEMQKICLDIPILDWRLFKEKCAHQGVSMAAIVRTLIKDYCQDSK